MEKEHSLIDQTNVQKLINLVQLIRWSAYSVCVLHCRGWQAMEEVDFQEKTIAARALWPSLDKSHSKGKGYKR